MDGVLNPLGAVEATVSEIRTQVGSISATLPHLATKADLNPVTTEVGAIAAVIPHLATKADLKEEIGGAREEIAAVKTNLSAEFGSVRGEIAALGEKLSAKIAASETRTIKWTIGIIIAVAGLAFTIAKYGH